MSREILFKGRCLHNEKWVEGGYCQKHETTYCFATDAPNPLHYYIACDEMADWNLPNEIMLYEVNPSTVCQYTGLTDRNGTKIFENDICTVTREDGMFLIEWDEDTARFVLNGDGFMVDFDSAYGSECEVQGNKFDNPELLEGGTGEE